MKKILIDGRFIGVGESMTRYTLEIVQGILKLDKENEYTLLIRPQGKKLAEELLPAASSQQSAVETANRKPQTANLKIEVLDIPHYSLAEQTKLLKYLNAKKFDLVHFIQFNHPVRYKGKYIVTVHDLTLLGHIHRMGRLKTAGFRAVMKSAVKDSAKIITDSKFSKNDILQMYKVDASKLEVIYLGVDSAYSANIKDSRSNIKNFKEKYGITGDYILYTGLWKRHKNILRMLKAFEKVCSQQFAVSSENLQPPTSNCLQLVFIGKPDPNEPEVAQEIERINRRMTDYGVGRTNRNPKSGIRNSVLITGFIAEEELPTAYAGAKAYCIPSLSEGFGLPPLEAMACGTPVISSSASCMPEILGDAAYYFDPYNVDSIKEAIEKITTDEKLRAELIEKGIAQAAKYDWAKTARQTYEVYKNVLNNK